MKRSIIEWTRLVLELGLAATDAIREGRTDKTVDDILPDRWRDRERLREISEAAAHDYEQ